MSKGSKRRPQRVSEPKLEERWARTFGPSYDPGCDILKTARMRVAAQVASGVRSGPDYGRTSFRVRL